MDKKLKEGKDYYLTKEGLLVFTAAYLLERGYCCKQGCRHCPYSDEEKTPGDSTHSKRIKSEE